MLGNVDMLGNCRMLHLYIVYSPDTAPSVQDFDLTLQDCLAGLAKAAGLGWYDSAAFDLARCVGGTVLPLSTSAMRQVLSEVLSFSAPFTYGHAAHLRRAAVSCAALLCRSLIDMRRADMRPRCCLVRSH